MQRLIRWGIENKRANRQQSPGPQEAQPMCETKEELPQKQGELRMKAGVKSIISRAMGINGNYPTFEDVSISLPQWGFAAQSLYLVAILSC